VAQQYKPKVVKYLGTSPERQAAERERQAAEREAESRSEAARQPARQEVEARREAARQAANLLEAVREAGEQGSTYHPNLDGSGRLWIQVRDGDGQVIGQPVLIANMWQALGERGIELQHRESEIVRLPILGELEVRATVKLKVGFFGGRTLLLPSAELRWLSLEERVADWYANLEGETGILNVTYYDTNRTEIHEDKIDVYDVLTKSGIKLQPKGSAVIRFALGADLMEATVELEVGFLGFSRKLKLLSVKRNRGEAWRLATPEKETP
jgi:K+/H+ antiporter YhaU regulatory subunit KhtT